MTTPNQQPEVSAAARSSEAARAAVLQRPKTKQAAPDRTTMNLESETLTLESEQAHAGRTDKGVGSGDWLGVRHSAIRELETPASKDFSCPPGAGWYVVPVTLRKANDFVACYHRHTGRTSRNGGKFAVGLAHEGVLKGCAILGNPLSATLMDGTTAEVLRVCVLEDAHLGACSQLYNACWRAWKAMGGRRLITYTLETENGSSLRGAGWKVVGKTKPCAAGWGKAEDGCNRTHTPVMAMVKLRWEVSTTPPVKQAVADETPRDLLSSIRSPHPDSPEGHDEAMIADEAADTMLAERAKRKDAP